MARLHLLVALCGIIALTPASSFKGNDEKNDNHCPKGWTQLNKFCYIFQKHPRAFQDAERVCQTLGGNLVSITSRIEHALVVELIREEAGAVVDTWTGLHDAVEDGDFIWTDGQKFKFQIFGPGQPDNSGGNEDCVEISAGDSLWNDDVCTSTNPFVCCRPVEKKDCH